MDDEDEWVRREVRIPRGTHLSKSRDSEGAERDLLREDGTNRLLGPTESRSVEEGDLYHAFSYESAPSQDSAEPVTPLTEIPQGCSVEIPHPGGSDSRRGLLR